MPRLSRPSPFLQWMLTFCVPFVALLMVGRQVYLNTHYGLSTWKGGGMGMFAAQDDLSSRYAKVFLVQSDGNRDALVQLRPEDTELLDEALEFPTRQNFLRAARQIAKENWIPNYQRRPVLSVDVEGDPIDAGAKSYRMMVPSDLRSDREDKQSNMEIQFWKIAYDPKTRHVCGSIAQTFVFTPQELYGPGSDQKNL